MGFSRFRIIIKRSLSGQLAAHVQFYTCFENPFLNIDEMGLLLNELWDQVRKDTGKSPDRTKVVDAHVPSVAPIPY